VKSKQLLSKGATSKKIVMGKNDETFEIKKK